MEKLPKFSIIIPVYNVEDYLSPCLDSVINQTLRDIEIICVDDGSRDNSLEILNIYKKCDRRITIISKDNGGLSSARNTGLKHAHGDYILFLDSDDCIALNTCERLYAEVLERRPEIIVFGAKIFPIYPYPDQWLFHNLSPRTTLYHQDSINALLNENGAYPFVWRDCFRRDFLEEHGLDFDETVRFAEDTIFQFFAFPFADDIVFIADKLYAYRWFRTSSLMHSASKNLATKYSCHITAISRIAEFWKEKGLLPKYGEAFFNWTLAFMGWDLRFFEGKEKPMLISSLCNLWFKYDLQDYYKKLPWKQRVNYYYLKRQMRKIESESA